MSLAEIINSKNVERNILFYEMPPWTEELLLIIFHLCCDQEWQFFSVCCHVQDNAGAQLQNQGKPLLMYSCPTYGQYLYNIHHWNWVVEYTRRRLKREVVWILRSL